MSTIISTTGLLIALLGIALPVAFYRMRHLPSKPLNRAALVLVPTGLFMGAGMLLQGTIAAHATVTQFMTPALGSEGAVAFAFFLMLMLLPAGIALAQHAWAATLAVATFMLRAVGIRDRMSYGPTKREIYYRRRSLIASRPRR